MGRCICTALVVMTPIALADGFKIVTQSRIEYKYTYHEEGKFYIQPDINFRLENDIDHFNNFETALWIVPRFRFGFGSWKLGPELRIPMFGTENWKLLLQAELDIHKWNLGE